MKEWIIKNSTIFNENNIQDLFNKTMIITLPILIALFGIYLDYRACRRIIDSDVNNYIKCLFVSVVALSYLLIVLVPVMVSLFMNGNNSAFVMKAAMVMLTTYLTLSVPRLLFYIMWLPTRRKVWLWVALAASGLLFATFIHSAFVTRTNYEVRNVELCYDNLPVEFDGYRVAFFSDMHIGTMVNAAKEIGDIVAVIDRERVDAVLFGGDIINIDHSEITPSLLAVLSDFKAHDGVYMVFGNHDTGAYVKNSTESFRMANMDSLEAKMSYTGWTVLRDTTVYIKRGDSYIGVTGIDYTDELLKFKHSMDAVNGNDLGHIYNNVDDSVFNITVSHLPQLWHALCDGGCSDLTLSGHIHAMQMKIGSFSPARFMYKEWSGLYEGKNGKLYINDGIGCVGYLLRFGARPEITVIELRCKE